MCRRAPRVLAAALALLTLFGPYGTYDALSTGGRALYWAAMLAGVGLFLHLAMETADRLPALQSVPPLLRIALSCAVGAVPATAVALAVDAVLLPPAFGVAYLPLLWLQVTAIGVPIGLLIRLDWEPVTGAEAGSARLPRLLAPQEEGAADPIPPIAPSGGAVAPVAVGAPAAVETTGPPEPTQAAPPRSEAAAARPATCALPSGPFLRRLPPALGTDVISLSMQDHYVEVTTAGGRHLMLMRMSDAEDELGPDAGHRIHRSHWVARGHLCALVREGPRHFAVLSDGRRLPVSAPYLEAVRAALVAQPG